MTSPDTCTACHQEPARYTCWSCGVGVCRSCVVASPEGGVCQGCHSDMLHFLDAALEVSDAPEVPHHGQEQLSRAL